MIIGIDTGGTFTDFIFKENKRWSLLKILSTPECPSEAVFKGLKQIAYKKKKQIVHGSTIATNAILERKGAKTALITNKRFEDIIEIGRQNRTRLYDLSYKKGPQIVPKGLRFGLNCRILHTGEEYRPLETEEAMEVLKTIKDLEIESLAVSFLFSYLEPSHEKRIEDLFQRTIQRVPYFLFLYHRFLSHRLQTIVKFRRIFPVRLRLHNPQEANELAAQVVSVSFQI